MKAVWLSLIFKIIGITRKEAVYIYNIGTIEGLIDKNILIGEKNMTPKGKRIYRCLSVAGFTPTERETEDFMESFYIAPGKENDYVRPGI